MNTYRVGRGESADIIVADPSVSRDHADLIEAEGGGYYLIDRDSSNGSFQMKDGGWVKLSKGYVTADEPIKLGSFETTVSGLLAGSPAKPSPKPPVKGRNSDHAADIAGPVERDSFGIPRPKK